MNELNLKPWRNVMEPNPDVAQGNYVQAEFALNLGDIVRNEGRFEYTDAVEFFSRTYLTKGLKTLLVETLKRLAGRRGEPIIQLKTAFGGGKSHSLLALYHLFGGKIRAEQSSAVREILDAAQVEFLPKVHTAVIVGTWENPLKSTFWGEMAMQLAESTGKPELYELMRENDEKKISPGVALLKKIFDEAGACLILIDELVAYGRKLSLGKVDGGTSGNFMSFIQELTEAVESSRAALVVSIPESDIELVDDLGRRVRDEAEKYFGRKEFVWTPVSEFEGYEIVRRRLFKDCRDEDARQKVCAAFFNMYVTGKDEFPYESRQKNFRERLLACYPIHPKLFSYFYKKWTNLENFQKTRGVLQFMAEVIYELWISDDQNLLIMPATLPLSAESVRGKLTSWLKGNWDSIVDAEVDGDNSKPRELDNQTRFGRLAAARKIARTIFMGTAPGSRQGDVRGLPENEIRLGVIQPHEVEEIPVYNDALTKLRANLYYLYSRDGRLWFGTNPTLRKVFDDKREQFSDADIEEEIEKRLAAWKGRGQFKAVHVCPKTFEDVPDVQTARLIILPPKYSYDGQENNAAFEQAKNFLDNRAQGNRRWRNMLLFMAADAEKLRTAKNFARDFLAWQSVNDEARHLNLDSLQLADAESNSKSAEKNFVLKLSQAYCKIFAPARPEDGSNLNVPMKVANIDCTKEDNISAASEKFVGDENLLGALGPVALLRWLDKFLWCDADNIQVKQLWDYFAEYYYLPRLVDVDVLLDAIRRGVKTEIFALAEDFRDGKYIELEFGSSVCGTISTDYLLVKAEVARKQLNPVPPPPTIEPDTPPDTGKTPPDPPPPPKILPTSFSMDVDLDGTRCVSQFRNYIDEIAAKIMLLPNAKTSIRVDISINVPEGIPQDTQEMVEDLCRSLKVAPENFRFEM